MKEYLGIDLGGTNFKAGRVSFVKIDWGLFKAKLGNIRKVGFGES